MPLNRIERSTLLQLARVAIQDALFRDGVLRRTLEQTEITAAMQSVRGLFVTLKKKVVEGGREGRQLRGCVGTITARKPLVQALVDTAPQAALQDPRFPPLAAEELPDVSISVSVLTPPQKLHSVEALVTGKHGVELLKGAHHAVFLPNVAVEQKWDADRLLRNLARKAGLPPDGWRDAELSTFEAEDFEEEQS